MNTFIMDTPIGGLLLTAQNNALTRLDFMRHEHECPADLPKNMTQADMARQAEQTSSPVLKQAISQLAAYFSGKLHNFTVPLNLMHCGTSFQQKCWRALQEIPYGQTRSYKNIAESIGHHKAFRAVGGANHNNPIAIIVPCHRVVGANNKMVGFGGGVWRKQWLLELERANA